jgi:peptide/nickel transport system ATP-binding protein
MNPLFPLIQVNNLTVDFPGSESTSPALHDFSFELNRGEMLAIVGESGSGKTVMSLALMNLLSKAARIVNGSALFSQDGREVVDLLRLSEKKYRSYRGNRLAMIFQEPMTSLNPVMTCGDQLCEPLIQHKKYSRSRAKSDAFNLLEKVQLTERDRIFKSYPHQLSGGQKQRVMIAMAISCHPDILICDEPTTALDVRVQRNILDLLKNLRRSENIGMIFITHDLGLVTDMADRALVMLKGRIVESGTVKEIFTNPRDPYTRGLMLCRPALHKKGQRLPVVSDFIGNNTHDVENPEKPLNQARPEYQVIHDRGHSSESGSSHVPEPEILVRVRDLSVRFSTGKNWLGREKQGLDAIRDVNFDVFRGETLGLVGESGSGKTTVGRALLGLNKPFRGSITYGSTNLLAMNKAELLVFRKNIQIVFQDPYSSLNPRLLVGKAIAEPIKVHESASSAERKLRVIELLQSVNLKPEYFNRYPFEFSGGQRQRIVIARALALYPGFVVFDESVSALDVSVQAQVLNLINDLKKNLGFTAVFISHDLSVIRYLCDRVIVMEKGKIVETGNAEIVYRNPQTEYTRSLIEAIPGKNL